jgi:hypothetical protein
VTGHNPIDVDSPATWPEQTHRRAADYAERFAGTTEYPGDLAVPLEQEDDFRASFSTRKLLAYHCTRLLPHEIDAIRATGLRRLDKRLIDDRVAAAVASGALTPEARAFAETRNVYASGNERYRTDQICFVLGRSTFDEDPGGCDALLRYWGGEAMRGGPDDAPLLDALGTPAIVVAQLNLTGSHRHSRTGPPLGKLFVATLLGLRRRGADVFYRDDVPGEDILDIWVPGQPQYDRHRELPA